MKALYITSQTMDNAQIKMWFRDEQGNKVTKIITDFRPYFYVPSKLGVYNSVFGEPLDRIYVKEPRDVPTVRERYQKHYEADIPYVRRYLIDKGIYDCVEFDTLQPTNCNIKPKVMYLDIEVELLGNDLPDSKNPFQKVTAVTMYVDDVYHTFFLNSEKKEKSGKFKLTANGKEYTLNVHVKSFTDEKEMLQEIYDMIKQVDIVAGWNVQFDMGYLPARAKKLGIRWVYDGWLDFDLLEGYKEFVRARSYKLKEVTVQEELETKDEAFGIEKINDTNALVKYNLRDVWRIVMLDRKYDIINYFVALKGVIGVEDFAFQRFTSIIVDTLLLRLAKQENVVLPTSVDRPDNPIKGAIVLDPPSGRYTGVAVFDMSRYYPSIIISFNISPEMKIRKINDEVAEFRQDKPGLMAKLVKILLDQREKVENEMKKYSGDSQEYKTLEMRVTALKAIINAVYGYMGHPQARFYDRDCASTITAIAREGIMYVLRRSRELGFKPLYGDTDSVFIQVEFDKAEELSKILTTELRKYFKEKYKLVNEPVIHLKYEKYLDAVYFTGVKKRYVSRIVWKKGKKVNEIDIKGFEAIRTDSAEITQMFEQEVFTALLDGKDFKEIYEIRRKYHEMARTLELEKIALVKGITKRIDEYKTLPPHVRAAVLANKYFGKQYGHGSRIRYVWCKGYKNGINTDVCIVDDGIPEPIVDWDKQLEAVIDGPFRNIGFIQQAQLDLWS